MIAVAKHGARRAHHVVPTARGHRLKTIEHPVNSQAQGNDDEDGVEMHALAHEERHDHAEQQALDQELKILVVIGIARVSQ